MDAGDIVQAALSAASFIVVVVVSWKYTRAETTAAVAQLQLAQRVREEQAQPYVFVDIHTHEQQAAMLMWSVENKGATIARDVRVRFEPPLSADEGRVEERRFSALAPGVRLTFVMGVGFTYFQNERPPCYQVTIDATGPFGRVEQLRYELDLESLRGLHIGAGTDERLEQVLKRIATSLDALARRRPRPPGIPRGPFED